MELQIEKNSMQAWPALKTVAYDGWQLRGANGLTKRSNSVYPLAKGHYDIEDKVAFCEAVYRDWQLPTVFKLYNDNYSQRQSSQVYLKKLDHYLRSRSYYKLDESIVMTCRLSDYAYQKHAVVTLQDSFNDAWINGFISAAHVTSQLVINTYYQLFLSIDGKVKCASVICDGQPIGFGYAHISGQYVGLFDIYIERSYRGQGYGRKLVESLLASENDISRTAYLQVVKENHRAIDLYESLGFKQLYSYWYRKQL